MSKKSIHLSLLLILAAIYGNAHAGKIVLANDEWTLSEAGYSQAISDPGIFATNVSNWFTGGTAGNYLAYSTNFGLTGSSLQTSITSAGHNWTVTTGISFDLATLSTYDGIFLAGTTADNAVLIDYVNAGGNVYLAGGTGWGGAVAEAARWNTFLNHFGLGLGTYYNGVAGNVAINSTHDIFLGVDHLYQNNGNNTLDINITDSNSQVIASLNGRGLYAVYNDLSVSIPEPTTLSLLFMGILGFALVRRRAVAMASN